MGDPSPHPSRLRGSEKLLWNRWQHPLTQADLGQLIESIDIDGVRTDDVFCHGTPQPDIFRGSLTVRKDVFDNLSNRLLGLKDLRLRQFEVFPYGIPMIDELRVDFEIGRGG